MPEQTLYEAHPAMFKNHPFWFVASIVLIAAVGLGLLILLVWWVQTRGTKLTVTNERITLRRGILSKHTNDVYHSNIRNVQISQGVMQRIFDVGTIGIATAGLGGVEIVVEGIPSPKKVKDLIDQYRREQ